MDCVGNKDENAAKKKWTKASMYIASGRNKMDQSPFQQHSTSFVWFINSVLNKPFSVNESKQQ